MDREGFRHMLRDRRVAEHRIEQQIALAQKAAAHSQKHAQPAPLAVPFLLD